MNQWQLEGTAHLLDELDSKRKSYVSSNNSILDF